MPHRFSPKVITLALMMALPQLAISAQETTDTDTLPDVKVVSTKDKAENTYVNKKSTGSTKTDTPLVETAQSVSIVNRQELDDRNVQDLNDAMAYTAGVRINVNGSDSRAETYNIRGFTMGLNMDDGSSNLFVDGLKMPAGGQFNRMSFDTFGLESVEVMKGPSAAVYGQIQPGGMVNLVTKKPRADQLNQIRLQYGSFDQKKAMIDVGGAVGNDDTVLFRLVGAISEGNTQVDHTDLRRTYLAPSLLFNFTDKTRLTLLAQYQRDGGGSSFMYVPYYGSYVNSPAGGGKMDRDTFLGEPSYNRFAREQVSVGWAFEHEFNDTWKFRQNLRLTSVDTDYRAVVSRGNGLNGTTSGRSWVSGVGSTDSMTVDNHLLAKFNWGDVEHQVLLGLDAQRTNWTLDSARGTNPQVSIFNPVYTGVVGAANNAFTYDVDQKQVGTYLQEQLAWNQWRFSIGGRYDRFDNALKNVATLPAAVTGFSDYEDHAFTWRTGLSYLFENGVTPYASYSTSFAPGPLTLVTANNAAIKPVEAEQYEAGIKYQPPGSNSLITAAIYELKQQNRVANDTANICPNNPMGTNTCSQQIGEARIRGLELEAKTLLTEQLSVIASYTYSASNITESAIAAEIGTELQSLPRHMAALWGNYVVAGGELDGLSLSLGARYTGSFYNANNSNSGVPDNVRLKLDGFTLYDAAVRYNLKRFGYPGADVAINANNLTDREYVSSCLGVGACLWGAARNVTATVNYRW